MSIWTDHPRTTGFPQTYFAHGRVACTSGVKMIWYGLLGVVHGVFPFVFPFRTSTFLIQSFVKLRDSGRHADEIEREMK